MLKPRPLRVTNALVRECMAEFLGTFVLLLFGCSAAAQVKTSRETKGQFLSVNMAFSVGVMSAMYLTKGITGAHLNPAVTLSFCVLGQVPWGRLLPYILSQLLGAYVASGLVYMVYYDAIMEFSGGVLTVYGPNETASIFATYPSEYLTLGRSFLDQVVGTGMLMLCILCLDEKRNTPAPTELIPVIVAVIVLGISMSMSANCGAAINPARDLGPRLFTLTAGWGVEVFTCYNYWFWVPLVAPLIGGVFGTLMYLVFIKWHLPDPDPPTDLPCLSTISDNIKQPTIMRDSGHELKSFPWAIAEGSRQSGDVQKEASSRSVANTEHGKLATVEVLGVSR
ncbi:aquaporin-10a [Aulostomus maculatus]